MGKENPASSLKTLSACHGICHLNPFRVDSFLFFSYLDFSFYLVLSFWHYHARDFDCKQNVRETPLNPLLGRKSIRGSCSYLLRRQEFAPGARLQRSPVLFRKVLKGFTGNTQSLWEPHPEMLPCQARSLVLLLHHLL